MLAAVAIWHWAMAIAVRAPVLYGEGMVAHAAVLARTGIEYSSAALSTDGRIFIAANYPPLYFRLAGLGDPLVAGRIVSVVCTLLVAAAIAYRARAAGMVVALALSAAWIATAPAGLWGPAVRPDMLALALTVIGVLLLERAGADRGPGAARSFSIRSIRTMGPRAKIDRLAGAAGDAAGAPAPPRGRDRASVLVAPIAAGAVFALAILAKPTAALPALALFLWTAVRAGPAAAVRIAIGGVAVGIVALLSLPELRPPDAAWLHIVSWNALPWSASSAATLALVGAFVTGVPVAVAFLRRSAGAYLAYLVAAIGIVALGGREGATINYLLDLAAAASLAVASIAPAVRARAWYPLAATAQLVLGLALLNPFGILQGRPITTGAWGDRSRVGVVAALPAGPALVEESGLLLADGREPAVDDLFLWSRLVDHGFIDPAPLLDAVARGAFVAVVSEADLERLDAAPAFERSRWDPALVRAVLLRYRLDATTSGLFVYLPR